MNVWAMSSIKQRSPSPMIHRQGACTRPHNLPFSIERLQNCILNTNDDSGSKALRAYPQAHRNVWIIWLIHNFFSTQKHGSVLQQSDNYITDIK